MRADQGLLLKVFLRFLVTMSNLAVIVGVYTVYSFFHLFFPNLYLSMNRLGV